MKTDLPPQNVVAMADARVALQSEPSSLDPVYNPQGPKHAQSGPPIAFRVKRIRVPYALTPNPTCVLSFLKPGTKPFFV